MKPVRIVYFWIKVVWIAFIFTGALAFVILLLAGNWDQVSLLQRIIYALISGVANGLLLGTIASIWMSLRSWRVIRENKKKLSRRESVTHDRP